MYKKIVYIFLLCSFFISTIPFSLTAEATTTTTFVQAIYTETVLEDGSVVEVPSKITLQNGSGKTTTLNVDESTVYFINNSPTTIHGFKKGMEVEATINLRKVKELRGTAKNVEQGAIVKNSKVQAGVVTKIDPNGLFITVKLDKGEEQNFFINKNTNFIKSFSTVDVSHLYEGDRVKLKFSIYNTSVLSEIEIIADGIQIERLYRGTIQSVNTSANRLTVQNGQPFENWFFGTEQTRELSTFAFEHNTPIYVGNKKITKNELRNYQKSTVYFVTVMEFSKEVIQKIVVLKDNERSYYGALERVNLNTNFIKLKTRNVNDYYHDGTIIVRNGRLVEPSSLTTYHKINGTAYVLTDGGTSDNYANVINIINDSFYAHNLFNTHDLYYGKISNVDGYQLTLTEVVSLRDWKDQADMDLSFSNSTQAQRNYLRKPSKPNLLIPEMDFDDPALQERFGYFYVKDGHITAAHILMKEEEGANIEYRGRVSTVNEDDSINVINVNRYVGGTWNKSLGELNSHSLARSLILKDGRVIKIEDIKPSDQVVIYSYGTLEGHVVIVN